MTRSISAPWGQARSISVLPPAPRPVGSAQGGFENSRALAGMLLAAALAAMLVVADQVIDTWTDGHLLAGWVALWTLVFAGLALLASSLRQLAANAAALITRQLQQARLRRLERDMWEHACQDPRIRADLQWVRTRAADLSDGS